MEDFHEISDKAYLNDIQTGKVTFIEVYCADGKVVTKTAHALAEAIKVSHSITAFDMQASSQEPGALSEIFQTLSECQKLKFLYVDVKGKSTLSDADVVALVKIITSCSELQVLYMTSMQLLPDQQIKIIGACILSQSLQKLNLRDWNLNSKSISQLGSLLEKSSSIRLLGLHNNAIGPNELSVLLKCLSNNRNSALEELELGSNPIGPIGLAALATYVTSKKITIKKLNLGWTDLNDSCADSLFNIIKCNSPLESLACNTNELGDDTLQKIEKAMHFNDHLVCLDLRSNNFHGNQQLAAVPDLAEIPNASAQLLSTINLKLEDNKHKKECNAGDTRPTL